MKINKNSASKFNFDSKKLIFLQPEIIINTKNSEERNEDIISKEKSVKRTSIQKRQTIASARLSVMHRNSMKIRDDIIQKRTSNIVSLHNISPE